MKILYPVGYIWVKIQKIKASSHENPLPSWLYTSQNTENALSMHKMGFRTFKLTYIIRGLHDNDFIISYLKIILMIFPSLIHGTFDIKFKAVIFLQLVCITEWCENRIHYLRMKTNSFRIGSS